jgi:AmmeMemoRadiSam system protein A
MTTPGPTSSAWLTFARQVIQHTARRAGVADTPPAPTEVRVHSGVFVTLHKHGRLRGCMGVLDDALPLAEAVRQAAISAAAGDPRFSPVAPGELPDVQVEVSILSPPQHMRSLDELELGRHGVLVQRGMQRGLFLPQVAVEHHMTKETFLGLCCHEKAGLPADAWRDPATEVLLFTAEVLREP